MQDLETCLLPQMKFLSTFDVFNCLSPLNDIQ